MWRISTSHLPSWTSRAVGFALVRHNSWTWSQRRAFATSNEELNKQLSSDIAFPTQVYGPGVEYEKPPHVIDVEGVREHPDVPYATKEAVARVKDCKVSPKRMNLLLRPLRGLTVVQAETQLQFCKKKAAPYVVRALRSAAANATHNLGLDRDRLVIRELCVGNSLVRTRPRWQGRGRVGLQRRRLSRLFVRVQEEDECIASPFATTTFKARENRFVSKVKRAHPQVFKKGQGEEMIARVRERRKRKREWQELLKKVASKNYSRARQGWATHEGHTLFQADGEQPVETSVDPIKLLERQIETVRLGALSPEERREKRKQRKPSPGSKARRKVRTWERKVLRCQRGAEGTGAVNPPSIVKEAEEILERAGVRPKDPAAFHRWLGQSHGLWRREQ